MTTMDSLLPEDPLHRNLLATAVTIVYVKTVVGVCDYGVSHRLLASRISRKIVHVAAGSWLIAWPLFSTDHGTWRLNIFVPALYAVQLLIKGWIVQDANDPYVRSMTRTGNPKELLNGPPVFTLVMCVVGLHAFQPNVSFVIMACLGFGDGIAPLAGYYFPLGRYPTWPFQEGDYKTLSGSLAFCVAAVMGYYMLASVALLEGTKVVELHLMVRVAVTAAVAESITGPYDNAAVALASGLTYHYLTTMGI